MNWKEAYINALATTLPSTQGWNITEELLESIRKEEDNLTGDFEEDIAYLTDEVGL